MRKLQVLEQRLRRFIRAFLLAVSALRVELRLTLWEHLANMQVGGMQMDSGSFSRLCAGVGRLTVGQIRALREKLRGLDARIEVLARIDSRCDGLDRCLHCGGGSLQGWGSTRTGLRRQRCTGCGRTFSSATGTAMARVRLPETFLEVVPRGRRGHVRT